MTEHNSELMSSMVIKRHRDGRRRFDAKAKRALVERCLQPDVSVAGLALEHGVNANLLRKWIMRYQRERDDATTAALPAPVEASAFVPVGHVQHAPAQAGIAPAGEAAQRRRPGPGRGDDRRRIVNFANAVQAAMFRFDEGLKVYLHRDAVDFRKSINGLAALVEQSVKLDPFARAVYAFSNQRRDRVKLLVWDRNGFWLLMKRLEQDRFVWPRKEVVLELRTEQLHWLLDGIDIEAMRSHPARFMGA